MATSMISTSGMQTQMRSTISDLQNRIAQRSYEVSSGRKYDVASQLRDQVSSLVDMRNSFAEVEQYITRNEVTESRMDIMQTALAGIQETADKVRNAAISATSGSAISATALRQTARAAADEIISYLNTSHSGRYLFSGAAVENKALYLKDELNPDTGLSPLSVVQAAVASAGPLTSTASLTALTSGPDGLDAIFSDSHSTPGHNFTETFYGGSTTERVSARIDTGQVIAYGLQGNDDFAKTILKGLLAISEVDAGSADTETYKAFLAQMIDVIGTGVDQLKNATAGLGLMQETATRANERHNVTKDILNNRIASLESVDQYEASIDLTALQTQIDITFNITAKISRLSLSNYL